MIRKIVFTNYISEFIHQVAIKFRFWKALQKKCFQSDIIFRNYVKMPPIKFSERLTKFMISISLSEKFCCQNLFTSIKVINMTRNSSKSNKLRNKLRNINTIGCRTYLLSGGLEAFSDHNYDLIFIKLLSQRFCWKFVRKFIFMKPRET